jgi:hypothetical protein
MEREKSTLLCWALGNKKKNPPAKNRQRKNKKKEENGDILVRPEAQFGLCVLSKIVYHL